MNLQLPDVPPRLAVPLVAAAAAIAQAGAGGGTFVARLICMRTIIAEYESLAEAERAVHALEAQLSIQNVVIRDQSEHRWKRRDQRRDRSLDFEHSANFVVSMSGTPEGIERARELLHTAVAVSR